jgi:hypothetical protein
LGCAQQLLTAGKVNITMEHAFEIAAIVAEAAVVGLLIYRRAWRKLPVFFVYCVWALLSDSTASAVKLFSAAGYGINFYLAVTIVDFALQFSVLVELAWSVLRPLRTWLSPRALVAIAALFLVAGAAIWPFAGIASIATTSRIYHLTIQLQQTASILRVLFFLLLAGSSHVLSLGWRDRELQVASGFGFYSLVSLAVAGLNTHVTGPQFRNLYYVVAVSFLCSLFYWVFSFAQQEAERQEFTPRMQTMLLALAGTARVTRVAFADQAGKPREPNGF